MTLHIGVTQYSEMVKEYTTDPFTLDISPMRVNTLIAASGISTASANFLSYVTDILTEKEKPDINRLITLLGHIEFSLEHTRQAIDVKRDIIILTNMSQRQHKRAAPPPSPFPYRVQE